jgi:hypothetical protein
MPPHCDSLDGPVVTAARRALEEGSVDLVLPFVPEQAEAEVRDMFATVLPVHGLSEEAGEVADRLFFETVVRLHRAGEGAPYTGLKPAGPKDPAIALAEQAVQAVSPQPIASYLAEVLQRELERRLDRVRALSAARDRSVRDGRRYVEAMLGFELYCHHVLEAIQAPAHAGHGVRGHANE